MLLRKYWFYSTTLLHVVIDLGNLIYLAGWQTYPSYSWPEALLFAGKYSFLCLGIINGVYLTTYGFLYTNTILGSFGFQQPLRLLLIGISSAIVAQQRKWLPYDGIDIPPLARFLLSFEFALYATSLGLHALVLAALWGLFIFACRSGTIDLGQWTTNVEDLAVGTRHPPNRLSWRGTKRYWIDGTLYRSRTIRTIKNFIPKVVRNALFRRVLAVETRTYAFCQHFFSLVAIALLLIRTVTLLTQLGNENLPSRTVVGECLQAHYDLYDHGIRIVVRHPEPARYFLGDRLNRSSLPYELFVGFQRNEPTVIYNSTIEPCGLTSTRVVSAPSIMPPYYDNSIDWFDVYTCNGTEALQRKFYFPGFIYYSVAPKAQNGTGNMGAYNTQLPNLWLASEEGFDTLTPYLIPPIRPVLGMHTVSETRFARRRFISSSPIRDAVTGSKPTYNTIDLFPSTLLYSQPITPFNHSDNLVRSSGFIRWPKFANQAIQAPQSDLKSGVRRREGPCEVTEEYRIGNTFDILASIGGLLALLQGLHVFFFGRPLFWGLFGAKIITPFGLFGRFATKGFRQRLQQHYYSSSSPNPSSSEQSRSLQNDRSIDMTRFLLDYVVDLGPASPPSQEPEDGDVEPISSRLADSSAEVTSRYTRDSQTGK